jgi:putative NIF3 family GTP cyclohydrolase 1 type 2
MGYHNALDAVAAGMATIELGHDVSELPLCAVLAEALSRAGVEQDNIKLLDQSNNWWTPEAIRL